MLAHDQMPIEAQAKALTDVTEHKTSQELLRNIQLSAASGTRSIVLLLMLVVGLAHPSALRARVDQNGDTVKIMTQNVDAGTDFGYFAGVSTLPAFLQGAYLTYRRSMRATSFLAQRSWPAKSPSIIQLWSAFKR
jgi:hypothetical protein